MAQFDDRPELVMESIAIRESQTDRAAAKDFGIEQAGAESAQGVSDNNHISQADSHAPAGTESTSVIKVKKEQARALVRSAREDLKKGRIESARRKAKAAASLDVTYSIMEDRPELVLADIDRRDPSSSASIASSGSAPAPAADGLDVAPAAEVTAAASTPSPLPALPSAPSTPSAMNAAPVSTLPPPSFPTPPQQTAMELPAAAATSGPVTLQPAVQPAIPAPSAAPANPVDAIAVIQPSGLSADELFNLGMQDLRQGRQDAAYTAFLQCYHSGQPLDRVRQRQLHDFLRDLAPVHGKGVRQVSEEVTATGPADSRRKARAGSTLPTSNVP